MVVQLGLFNSMALSTALGKQPDDRLQTSLNKYLSTAGGNMILVEHATDFELYSSTSKGAMQGYGYIFHACRH